jgi:hypothetical protein
MPSGVNSKWQLKQALPTANQARGLWRMLNIAAAPGWEKGFTDTQNQACPRVPGAGQFGTPAVPIAGRAFWEVGANAGCYPSPFENYGRQVYKSDIVSGSYRFTNLQTFPPIISYETVFGFTVAILWRPRAVTAADDPIVVRRVSPFGVANAGWSLHTIAGNVYQFRISDGAVQASVASTTTQNTERVDLLVATYDRSNLRFFVNGVLEATTAATLTVGNVNRSIRIYGASSADGTAGMMAMWNRALARSEVSQLYSDPFFIWRPNEDDEADFTWQTYLAAF